MKIADNGTTRTETLEKGVVESDRCAVIIQGDESVEFKKEVTEATVLNR